MTLFLFIAQNRPGPKPEEEKTTTRYGKLSRALVRRLARALLLPFSKTSLSLEVINYFDPIVSSSKVFVTCSIAIVVFIFKS